MPTLAEKKAQMNWRSNHQDHYRAKCREYSNRYAQRNPDKIRHNNAVAKEFRKFLRILL